MVRVSATFLARPEWYDRNPITKIFNYNGANVAPHAITQRFTYTVPAGKKAIIEAALVYFYKRTVQTTLGLVGAYIDVNLGGAGAQVLLSQEMYTNNVGDKDHTELGTTMLLSAGDIIRGFTFDLGTGGGVTYILAVMVTEYDA